MFPTPFTPLFQKTWSFLPKIEYQTDWWETDKPKHFLKNEMFEMILHALAVSKASNWNKL